jgi:predicted Zn-dependent protease
MLAAQTPALPEMRLYLGHAYFLSGRIPECRAICEALLAETPDSPFASAGRAHVAMAEGNYDEALSHLASGQKAYGMVAALDAVVGEAYLKIGKYEHAAAAFRSAIQTDAGIPAPFEGLARALLALGQHSEAAEAALDAIRLRYDLPGAHNVLSRALQGMGREEAAAGAFANAETLSRRLPVA